MSANINTVKYWDHRFASGDWEQQRGRSQTASFAAKQVQLLSLPTTFDGSMLDFGCGLGDALPIYKSHFPSGHLIGLDHSDAAITACRNRYGDIATFIRGGCESVPIVDVIVASNVVEHITDNISVVRALLSKCSELYIFVPYLEKPLCREHVHRYDTDSFSCFERLEVQSFYCPGWSQYGYQRWVGMYLKNLLRPIFGKPLEYRRKQIMFRLKGRIARQTRATAVA